MAKLKIKEKYGQAPNELLNNTELSLKAKGMFTFLQSKPENWEFSVNRISEQTKEGRDGIRNALKELEEKGYLERIPSKKSDGTWEGYDYRLTDSPFTENPSSDKPSTDEPSTVCPFTPSKKEGSKQEAVRKNQKKNSKKEQNHDITWAREVRDGTADVSDLSGKYEVSGAFIRDSADEMVNYVEAHGKKYKDYKAMLRNWIKNKRANPKPREKSPHSYGKWRCKQGYEHEKGQDCGHKSMTIRNNKFKKNNYEV